VLLRERGAKRVVPLAVSGAFHSPLMESAALKMRETLHTHVGSFADPALPIIANVTANYENNTSEIVENLSAQVAGPVRWVESTMRLYADGYTIFVECGPGNVLAGLIKRIAPEATIWNVNDTATLKAAAENLTA
jgi:[acyl-carrier-protein] S-malonyltransferase